MDILFRYNTCIFFYNVSSRNMEVEKEQIFCKWPVVVYTARSRGDRDLLLIVRCCFCSCSDSVPVQWCSHGYSSRDPRINLPQTSPSQARRAYVDKLGEGGGPRCGSEGVRIHWTWWRLKLDEVWKVDGDDHNRRKCWTLIARYMNKQQIVYGHDIS